MEEGPQHLCWPEQRPKSKAEPRIEHGWECWLDVETALCSMPSSSPGGEVQAGRAEVQGHLGF